MKVKKVIGYSALILLGILLGLLVVFCECDSYRINSCRINSLSTIFSITCDAFFLPGLFLFGIWLLSAFKKGGFFDFIVRIVTSIINLIRMGVVPRSCRKAYRAYKRAAKEETGSLTFVLYIALVFLALSATFLILSNYL